MHFHARSGPMHKSMDAPLSTLRQMGIRILNYLDDWLVLARSEWELIAQRSLLLSHLECLGLKFNLAKSCLSPGQRVVFLGTIINSIQMWAWDMPERSLTIQRLPASFKVGTLHPLRAFQRVLGLLSAATSMIPLGLHNMQPIQFWLKAHAWRLDWFYVRVTHHCIRALAPWKTEDTQVTGALFWRMWVTKVLLVSSDFHSIFFLFDQV